MKAENAWYLSTETIEYERLITLCEIEKTRAVDYAKANAQYQILSFGGDPNSTAHNAFQAAQTDIQKAEAKAIAKADVVWTSAQIDADEAYGNAIRKAIKAEKNAHDMASKTYDQQMESAFNTRNDNAKATADRYDATYKTLWETRIVAAKNASGAYADTFFEVMTLTTVTAPLVAATENSPWIQSMIWQWNTVYTAWETLREDYLDNLDSFRDNYDSPRDALFALLAENEELLSELTDEALSDANPFIVYQATKLTADAEYLYTTATLRQEHEAIQDQLWAQYNQTSQQTWMNFSLSVQTAQNNYTQTNATTNEAVTANQDFLNFMAKTGTAKAEESVSPSVTMSGEAKKVSNNPQAVDPKAHAENMKKIRKESQELRRQIVIEDRQKEKKVEETPSRKEMLDSIQLSVLEGKIWFYQPNLYTEDGKNYDAQSPEDQKRLINFRKTNTYPTNPEPLVVNSNELQITKQFGQFQISAYRPTQTRGLPGDPYGDTRGLTALSIRYFPTKQEKEIVENSLSYSIKFIQIFKSHTPATSLETLKGVTGDFLKTHSKWMLDGAEDNSYVDSRDIFWKNNGVADSLLYDTKLENYKLHGLTTGYGHNKAEGYYYMIDRPGAPSFSKGVEFDVEFYTIPVMVNKIGEDYKIVAWLGYVHWDLKNQNNIGTISVLDYSPFVSNDIKDYVLKGVQNKIIEQDYGINVLALKKYDGDVDGEKEIAEKIKDKRKNGSDLRWRTPPFDITLDNFLDQEEE